MEDDLEHLANLVAAALDLYHPSTVLAAIHKGLVESAKDNNFSLTHIEQFGELEEAVKLTESGEEYQNWMKKEQASGFFRT